MSKPVHLTDSVFVGDQTTPPFDFYFSQATNAPTTSDGAVAIDDRTIDLDSTTGFVDGTYVGIFDPDAERYYFGNQIGAPSGNTITLDNPFDFAFPDESTVVPLSRDMDVNGSVTPQTFEVQGSENIVVDITRIILLIETATTPELSDFGDIAGGLVNGLVVRTKDGFTKNIFNWKSNADISNACYDLSLFSTGGIFGGAEGFVARISFAGQDKHGVAIRLGQGDSLECIVQDNLTSLTKFRILAQGHEID